MSEATGTAAGRSPVDMSLSLDEGGSLPLESIVTGRGFCCGKSGSGKSNTASVVAEAVLSRGIPCLIVDTDGEYVSLNAEFELLHAGAGADCDVTISSEGDAHELARTAVMDSVPVVFDISEFFDEDHAHELVADVARELFRLEKREQTPLLLLLEECHEYLPNKGGGDVADVLTTVAKRGRKRGLGVLGLSQRPADVKTSFITQADWVVWHRLTWKNDTKVVSDVLSREYADAVSDLDDGESFVMADWADDDVSRVQWPRKQSPDLGAAPSVADAVGLTPDSLSGDVLKRFDEPASDESDETACSGCPFCSAGVEPPAHLAAAAEADEGDVLGVYQVSKQSEEALRLTCRPDFTTDLGLDTGDTVGVGVEEGDVRLYLDAPEDGLVQYTVYEGPQLGLLGRGLELLAVESGDHVRFVERDGNVLLERVTERKNALDYPILARKQPYTGKSSDDSANAVGLPTAVVRYLGAEDRVGVRHHDDGVYLTHAENAELSYTVADGDCITIGAKALRPLDAREGDEIVARPAGMRGVELTAEEIEP